MAKSDAFYLEIAAEVKETLEEYGTTYQVRGPGVYDPDKLERVPVAPRTVSGIVADQKSTLKMVSSASDVTWVGTKNLILSAEANPKPEEEVLVDGKWYSLQSVQALKPADIVVVYILDVTR